MTDILFIGNDSLILSSNKQNYIIKITINEESNATFEWAKYFKYRYQPSITNIISVIESEFVIYSHKYEEFDVDTWTIVNSTDGKERLRKFNSYQNHQHEVFTTYDSSSELKMFTTTSSEKSIGIGPYHLINLFIYDRPRYYD